MTATIFDSMSASLEALGDADILSTSANLRLRSGGQRTTFPVEDRTGFITCTEVKLIRCTLMEQNAMPVLRVDLAVANEKIGLLGDNDAEELLPIYTLAAFTTWRTWSHRFHTEFMNPNMESVATLKAALESNGFVPWAPRSTSQAYTRTSTILWDIEAKGSNMPERYRNGLPIETATIVPARRVAPLVTSYERDGEEITKPAFTGLIDAIAPGVSAVAEAVTAKRAANTQEERESAQASLDSSMNRLSILTGRNPEGDGWPLRPTLGYITPVGGKEISLFPVKDESASMPAGEVAPVAPTQHGEDPFTV